MLSSANNLVKKLSDMDFERLSQFINQYSGIKMPLTKKVLLESRLQKRLTALDMGSFASYCDLVLHEKEGKQEIIHMIDLVSTNKTDFFRENDHFEFLRQYTLPDLSSFSGQKINVWSAGCSSGEEPYTIAMVLEEYAQSYHSLDYKITGTDISNRMLHKASKGVYEESRMVPVSDDLKKKYFLRGKDQYERLVRVKLSLRNKTSFQRLNFMDDEYKIDGLLDIVFCRNVLIYFERQVQEDIINKICRKLKTGGYFFLGHSESTMGMNVPLEQVRPTIFKKI